MVHDFGRSKREVQCVITKTDLRWMAGEELNID